MQITERQDGDIYILSLEGRLDHAGAMIFQQRAQLAIQGGARLIVVDFGNTSFVASMGIRSLIVPAQEVSRQGGKFAMTGLNPEVHRLFEISGLLTVFKVHDTLEEAIASLRPAA